MDATAIFLEVSRPMRVFLSTVVRGAPMEKAGELISLDWEKKEILKRVPIYPSNPQLDDPNARGGGRGGRGIALLRDELFVANYHTLLGFDYQLNPTRSITSHNFAGLHEVKAVEDGIWTASTALGCVQKIGFDGTVRESWWAHDDPLVQAEFPSTPLTVDKTRDNRLSHLDDLSKLHLNNVEVHSGRVYVCFNKHGAVIRLFPTEVVSHDPALKGCHNGLVTNDAEFIINDSHNHAIVVLDLKSGQMKRRIELAEFPPVAELMKVTKCRGISWKVRLENLVRHQRVARPLFTRGMCRLDETRILVGVSPATILEIDYKKGHLLDLCQLSDSANECVHGLEAAPSADAPFSVS